MKEFSGLMRVEIEVIIKAKNQGEAEKIFDDIYPNISIEKVRMAVVHLLFLSQKFWK